MPKLVTSDKPSKKLRWDAKRKSFVGWQIDVYVSQGAGKKPKRHRVTYPSETEAKSAENRLAVRNENIKRGIEKPTPDARVKVIDLLNKRLSEIEAPVENKRAQKVFAYFLELNPELVFVDEIRQSHFDAFIRARESEKKKVKASTIVRELAPLQAALTRAPMLFKELADFQPIKIRRPKFKKTPRQTNISAREKDLICGSILTGMKKYEKAARTKARPVVANMFELAWFLGLRLGEVLKLEKKDFDFEQKKLRAVRWKTGTVTQFDFLPARVCEILCDAGAQSKSEFIFDLPCGQTAFQGILRDACEANNIPYGRDTFGGVTFHSNRHSFTSRIVEIADVATAQSFTGHANASMVAYYSHTTDRQRRNAMARLYGNPAETREKLKIVFEKVLKKELNFDGFLKEILDHFQTS